MVPQIPNRYIKVPKEIILANTLPEHRISVLTYLNYNQTWDEMVHYSPIYMIQWSGYKANWRSSTKDKPNIYDKHLSCMNWYFENGYILDFDSDRYTQNNFQSSLLNMEKLIPGKNFGIIYDFEIATIMKYQSSYKPLNRSILLLLLSYVRAFTWTRTNEITGHSEKSKKDKPEIFHSNFEAMGNFLGMNRKMVSRATTVLEELGLIKTYRMPSYKDKESNWRTDDIIYIFPYKILLNNKTFRICDNDEYDWERELKYGIQYLFERRNKKFYQE